MQTWVHKGTVNHRASTQEKLEMYLAQGYELGPYIDPQKKLIANKKASETVRKQHLLRSEQEKEVIAAKIRKTFVEKSPEEREEITNKRLQTRANWSEEAREQNSRSIREGQTEEVKEKRKQSFHNTLSTRSEEKSAVWRNNIKTSINLHYANLSESERENIAERTRRQMANMPPDKKVERNRKIANTLKQTLLSRYGVSNPAQCEEFREKLRNTNLERYGVPYSCMTKQCKAASNNNSTFNLRFAEMLTKAGLQFERELHIGCFNYDFAVDKCLVEIDPSPYHNATWSPFDTPKDKNYHFNKSKVARENGYRCIHVWDWDDWDKVVSLLLPREKVYARNCVVKQVNKKDCINYLNKYHLQGYAKSTIDLGLYCNDELVSIMTFGSPRYNKNYEYELIRYCSHKYVVGGAEKLFSYFVKNYSPLSIISYCDNSKFNGDVYNSLGFDLRDCGIPTRHWFNINTGQHITDNLLRQRGFDQLFGTHYGKGTSNDELMIAHSFVEIYDCGQSCYMWKKN